PGLGLVSAVRSARVHKSACSSRRWKRMEECAARRLPVCLRPSPKPFTLFTYLSRRNHLGHYLSTTTKSLRTSPLTRSHVDNSRSFRASPMDEQPARRVQILWLVRAIPV